MPTSMNPGGDSPYVQLADALTGNIASEPIFPAQFLQKRSDRLLYTNYFKQVKLEYRIDSRLLVLSNACPHNFFSQLFLTVGIGCRKHYLEWDGKEFQLIR